MPIKPQVDYGPPFPDRPPRVLCVLCCAATRRRLNPELPPVLQNLSSINVSRRESSGHD